MFRVRKYVTASFPSKENIEFIDTAKTLDINSVCEVVLEHLPSDKVMEITKALQSEYEYQHQYD